MSLGDNRRPWQFWKLPIDLLIYKYQKASYFPHKMRGSPDKAQPRDFKEFIQSPTLYGVRA